MSAEALNARAGASALVLCICYIACELIKKCKDVLTLTRR